MSKKFKSQASSSRAAAAAASSAFGAFGSPFGGATPSFSGLGNNTGVVSSLSYISEPPDLSTISEPNVVVAFKNLLKKDSTTKAKALDELQELVVRKAEEKSALEDGFLEAWFNVYPRLSIDISRRVRQVAHSVHGTVVSTAGKRVARLMPRVIGAWLAGLYDNDRPVMRAAQESFLQVFTTDAKRQGVWKVYQEPILDFVEDAILVQTPLTLSDERSTRPDDMELKHARVVATATYTCNNLLSRLSPSEREKNNAKLQVIIPNKRLWAFAHHDDPFVRRAIYSLLQTLLPIAETYLDWKVISSSLLSKSLAKNQTGSSLEYINTLIALSENHPAVWTTDYSGKKSALSRLYQYIRNGSEGAPAAYWEAVGKLLRTLPTELLASADGAIALSEATNLMDAIHGALSSRDEFRPNLPTAWSCYIATASYISQQLAGDNDRHRFAKSHMFPILENYFQGESQESKWVLPPGSAIPLSTECFVHAVHAVGKAEMIAFWGQVTDQLVAAIRISEPESSRTYKSSQDAVCSRSDRCFSWEAYVLDKKQSDDALSFVPDMFKDASKPILEAAITLLESRNGKPYGAAAVVKHITTTPFLKGSNSDILNSFIASGLPKQILTPSGSWLLSVLFACRDNQGFSSGFEAALNELNNANIHSLPSDVIQKLFSFITADDLQSYPVLKQLIDKDLALHLDGRRDAWDEIAAVLENPASHGGLGASLVTTIVGALYLDKNTDVVLKGISDLLSRSGKVLLLFANGTSGSKLISRLLYFSENATDSTEEIVASMLRKLKMARGGEGGAKSAIEILHHNFINANEASLSVDTMIEIAQEALSVSPDDSGVFSQVLPTSEQWSKALEPFLQLSPNPSEAIINSLGGLASLALRPSREGPLPAVPASLDAHGFSAGYRLAFFVTKMMKDRSLDPLDEQTRDTLFTYLPLATQIINSDLSIAGSKQIVLLNDSQIQYECAEVISESRSIIKNWMHASDAFSDHWESKIEDLQGRSVKSYLLAETFVATLAGEKSWNAQTTEERLRWCRKLKTQESPFALAAVLATYKDSVVTHPLGVRLCNELVADLTSMGPNEEEAIPKLVQLRTLGSEPLQQVQNQRLVILVNRLISRLEDSIDQVTLASEIALALYEVIPSIKEMYGSQWSSLFDILREMWNSVQKEDKYLPFVHASLRLFTRLRSMAIGGESNEDLEEAWAEAQKGHSESIIKLLGDFGTFLRRDQPRMIVADLLARTASSLSVEHLENTTNLLSTLTVDSKSIQQASRSVLQQAIPKAMEELSLGVALSEKGVELPNELLGILSRTPTMDLVSQAVMDESIWSTLRSYFLAWSVIFDFFTHASIPVKEQYTAIIKEKGLIPEFLDFTYEFLQQANGKLVDASKFDIRNFELDQSSSDEKEAKWFAIHLYYLSLRHLPNLTTLWWSESKNRIKGPVEVWTEKCFSPLVIEDALKGVQGWVASQDWSQEDQPMEVKVSFNVKEIVASIEIDEDSPPSSICISMPTAYPLHLPIVTGRTRIAVSEKKWQSWLRTISGAVKFQGSLIDALIIYRRNTQGALKGQSECAICYSIVSPAMKLPNKKCATCKNTFHSDCLFRWFTSSNASSCPLCRNNFIYS